ncbi:MAG TPA: hypothetical protein ENK62_09360, partial [Chromatiales bacterium]|nr:hypothetical protein [Chromatiales bacterium]
MPGLHVPGLGAGARAAVPAPEGGVLGTCQPLGPGGRVQRPGGVAGAVRPAGREPGRALLRLGRGPGGPKEEQEEVTMNFEALTLETVGDGELQAIFEACLREVLHDIEDEAKVRTATRTITLTVQITPHERDNAVDIVVS